MRKLLSKLALFSALASVVLASGCRPPANWKGGLVFQHVLVIVLENTNYCDAAKDPYLASLARRGVLMSNFHGNFHPSYPNYLAMTGGDYFWTFLDFQKTINATSIADLLEAKGLTWKNYAEGYPGGCFLGSTSGRYARKHVPFLSYKGIQQDPARCANVVPAEQLQADLAAHELPNYALYSPNLDNDGHDSNLPYASKWLKGFLEPILADPAAMDGTLIEITFDESKSYLTNHIETLFLGPMVKTGFVDSGRYTHYNVLRTIEENFDLGTLGRDDQEADPILSIWSDSAIDRIKQAAGI